MIGVHAELVAPRDQLDIFDQQGIGLARPMTAIEARDMAMYDPLPGLGLAFRIHEWPVSA